MESPDIVIEEDYISKPSPAKKPNLGNGPVKEIGGLKEKEAELRKELEAIEAMAPRSDQLSTICLKCTVCNEQLNHQNRGDLHRWGSSWFWQFIPLNE